MRDSSRVCIKIWEYSDAPVALKQLFTPPSHWVALIPASLAFAEVEALFLRSATLAGRILHRRLSDGSILLWGGDLERGCN
jgi:hypothetical protein